jgi:hypothetical protein
MLWTVALSSLFFAVELTSAQDTQQRNGIVRGVVRDETRAPVPGAKVTLSSLAKNDVRTFVSNPRGEYSFEAPVGLYEVMAELSGFDPAVVGPITLKEGETVKFDLVLKVPKKLQNPVSP